MLFKDRFFQNAVPFIVGSFLLGLIAILFFTPVFIFMGLGMSGTIDETTAVIFVLLVILAAAIGTIFYVPFFSSALYHSMHKVLVERENITIGDIFRNGKKQYVRYLGYMCLLMLITFAVEMVVQITSFIGMLIPSLMFESSEGLAIVSMVTILFITMVPYIAFSLIRTVSMFRVEMSESAVQGAIFPITAWKQFKTTTIFTLIILGSSIAYGFLCLITLGIGFIFQPLYMMFLYEQYLKYYHPKVLEDLYTEHLNTNN